MVLKPLEYKEFQYVLAMSQLYEVWWFYFSVCCKADGNSSLRKNWKESSSSIISTEVSFDNNSNVKTFNVN